MIDDYVTRSQAEKVVSQVVNSAVEKFSGESVEKGHYLVKSVNGMEQRIESNELHEQVCEENIRVEEESSIKASSTKIVLNGEESVVEQIERAQSEFMKKEEKKIQQSSSHSMDNQRTTETVTVS